MVDLHDAGGRDGDGDDGRYADNPDAIVRVPWNDPVRIKRLLDLGPDGLLVPMVNTAAEARDAVAATRYPPDGVRGVAAARASDYGRDFESYVREGHRELTLVVQVETEDAVRNADAIETVIDAGEEAGVPVGTLGATPEQVRALGSLGFDYVVAGVDTSHLVAGQERSLEAARYVL